MQCPLHTVTGLWCPFCGGTRAVHALLGGHLATAVRYDAVALPLLAAAAVGWLAWFGVAAGWWRSPPGLKPGRAWLAVAGLLVVFGVARNLPGLGVLAPPG